MRDYETGVWVGGDPDCEHEIATTGRGVWLGEEALEGSTRPKHVAGAPHRGGSREDGCRCGAILEDHQIGLEATVSEYVAALVDVFREVRRVLRDDGVAWLNLGDTYASRWGSQRSAGRAGLDEADRERHGPVPEGVKDKDLIGVPWRVAFALQDDGWWLRSDVVWAKPNPVPESVGDRPTRSHEYVFLLAKAKRYHYDSHAIREAGSSGPSDQAKVAEQRARPEAQAYRSQDPTMVNGAGGQLGRKAAVGDGQTRNRRTVWTIPTQPFHGAHFAVFPTGLAEPCVLAGTSPMACSECGGPYVRLTRRRKRFASHSALAGRTPEDMEGRGKWADTGHGNGARGDVRSGPVIEIEHVGWRPSCVCGAPEGLGMRPDDLEPIESPVGDGGSENDWQHVGRAGLARERQDDEQTVTISRYEQRAYAAQLRAHREEAIANRPARTPWVIMAEQVGIDALIHYARTDRAGARAIPVERFDEWVMNGWLELVAVPQWDPPPVTECVVLDPFAGSGTVGVVCGWHGRRFVGVELSAENAKLALDRITAEGKPGRRPAPRVKVPDDQLSLLA